jgi:hypothetical protein
MWGIARLDSWGTGKEGLFPFPGIVSRKKLEGNMGRGLGRI